MKFISKYFPHTILYSGLNFGFILWMYIRNFIRDTYTPLSNEVIEVLPFANSLLIIIGILSVGYIAYTNWQKYFSWNIAVRLALAFQLFIINYFISTLLNNS